MDLWTLCFIISTSCLAGSFLLAFILLKVPYKSGRLLTPSRILFAGVVLSALFLFIPIYKSTFNETECGWVETILISLHNMIRLFVVDGEFSFITDNVVSEGLFKAYSVMFSVLFVLAPFLTFGFVLSFFKNLSAHTRYVKGFFKEVFVFSELNEKSLALAESLKNNGKKRRSFFRFIKRIFTEKNKGKIFKEYITARKRLLVFNDVFEREEEQSFEMIERARELGAICFKKDILAVNYKFHGWKVPIHFFNIAENQSENISQALRLIDKYKYRKETNLYVLATSIEAEILLASAFNEEKKEEDEKKKEIAIKVRRINEVQSLIFRNIYEKGFEMIFDSAIESDGVKKINAMVIGLGQHGMEMTKALTWAGQMDGYDILINSFDKSKTVKEEFQSKCPELVYFSGKDLKPQDTSYTVNINPDINVDSVEFDRIVTELPQTTYAFVALGDDEKNIAIAIKLRILFERLGYKTKIQAVVYNTDKKEALSDVKNYAGQGYNIDFIGDMKTSYSEEVILDSEVEDKALERHKKWGSESSFWQFDYNYKSSVASAIHSSLKRECGIPGIHLEPEQREEADRDNIRMLEHRRWNAYMRSEGFIYSGSIDKATRNGLAKLHNWLVPFDELPLSEKVKDDD